MMAFLFAEGRRDIEPMPREKLQELKSMARKHD
jgi:hypothetical protein